MPLPANIDPAYVWCLLWFGVAIAVTGLITQQMGTEGLTERVRARTYSRLGRLNEFLTRRLEEAWKKTPTDDLVPDIETLRMLESEVNRAAAIDHRLRDRGFILSIGRLAAVSEAIAALLMAAIAGFTGARSELVLPSILLVGIGGTTSAVALLLGAILALRLERGAGDWS